MQCRKRSDASPCCKHSCQRVRMHTNIKIYNWNLVRNEDGMEWRCQVPWYCLIASMAAVQSKFAHIKYQAVIGVDAWKVYLGCEWQPRPSEYNSKQQKICAWEREEEEKDRALETKSDRHTIKCGREIFSKRFCASDKGGWEERWEGGWGGGGVGRARLGGRTKTVLVTNKATNTNKNTQAARDKSIFFCGIEVYVSTTTTNQ